MDVNQTYCDYFTIYPNTESCCTPETNMSIISQFKKGGKGRYDDNLTSNRERISIEIEIIKKN